MRNTFVRTTSPLGLSWLLVATILGGAAGKVFGQIGSGACCFPDASCAVVNVFSCTSAGGTFRGGTSCTSVVCRGACCQADGNCQQNLSQLACTGASGVFLGVASACAGQTCGGACCQSDGTCRISNNLACSGPEVFHGLGSVCADVDCAGACCDITGNCRTSNNAACAEPEIFHGLSSECADVDCVGACCAPGGECLETSAFDCADREGIFLGLDAECQDAVCVGACCLPNKGCTLTGFGSCQGLLGVFQGLDSVCGDDCPTVMPTAFTYQGQLKRNGVPHNGLVDARFTLWLSPTGEDPGNQVSSTLQVLDLEVVNGLFTPELDFGQNTFNGNARWLEIQILDQNDPSGQFITLSPRQPLTPVPYALQTRGIVVREDGSVGIGTKLAQSPLHVAGTGFSNSSLQPGVHIARDSAGNAKIELVNNGGAPYIDFINDNGSNFDGRIRLTADDSLAIEGVQVGIGTSAPDVRLHVTDGLDAAPGGGGFIQTGLTSGQNVAIDENEIMARNNGAPTTLFLNHDGGAVQIGEDFATVGEENLRIIRGTVNANGALRRGTGFSVTNPANGNYLITFTTPFSGSPSMTVTWEGSQTATPLFAATDNVEASTANVLLQDGARLHRNGPFHFIAVGPR